MTLLSIITSVDMVNNRCIRVCFLLSARLKLLRDFYEAAGHAKAYGYMLTVARGGVLAFSRGNDPAAAPFVLQRRR